MGVVQGDSVLVTSRAGETVLTAELTDRVQPGVVYTTFHHPESGANVVTTDNSDWATNCPEYKVTAVHLKKVVAGSAWQTEHQHFSEQQRRLLAPAKARNSHETV
jgi:formate dehydrogenase major subunit